MSSWLGCSAQLFGQALIQMLLWRYFLRSSWYLKHWLWVKQIMVHNVGGSLKGKDWGPGKRKKFCLQTVFGPKIAILIPARISHLPACLEYFRLARSDNCVGLFLKVNLNFSFSFILSLSYILLVQFLWRTLIYTAPKDPQLWHSCPCPIFFPWCGLDLVTRPSTLLFLTNRI